jgi:hypothetical protein
VIRLATVCVSCRDTPYRVGITTRQFTVSCRDIKTRHHHDTTLWHGMRWCVPPTCHASRFPHADFRLKGGVLTELLHINEKGVSVKHRTVSSYIKSTKIVNSRLTARPAYGGSE